MRRILTTNTHQTLKASALRCFAAIAVAMWLCFISVNMLSAQNMPAWEREAHGRIDQLRRKNLKVIVLGQDQKPMPQSQVNIQQRGHAMALGMAVGLDQLPLDLLHQQHLSDPFFRVLNSVNLGDLGRWDQLEPEMGLGDWGKLRYWMDWAHETGLTVRYGSMFSANPAHQADWAALLGRRDLMASIELQQRQIISKFAGRVIAFDLYGHALGHRYIDEQLSTVMVRRMFEQASAQAPRVPMAVQMDDVLDPQQIQGAIKRMSALLKAFVPVNQWSVSVHIPAGVEARLLSSGLDWLSSLKIPIVVSRLTFAADCSPEDVRTTLILLYGHPGIQGIYLGMPSPQERASGTSLAMVDAGGHVTAAGQVVDDLLAQTWISRGNLQTDELGSVLTRVFCGLYDLSATLPDGQVAYTSVYVDSTESTDGYKTVVLSPLAVTLEPLK